MHTMHTQVLIPVGAEAHSHGGLAPMTAAERGRFNIAMGLPKHGSSVTAVVPSAQRVARSA